MDFTEAIRLDPLDSTAYVCRGNVLGKTWEFDRAVEDHTEAIRLDPTNILAWTNRGIDWERKGEHEKAISDFTEAIRLDPRHRMAYKGRGKSFEAMEQFGNALADYLEQLRLGPNDSAAYNDIAWLHATCPDERYRNGKIAVECGTKACELTGWKSSNCLDTLAAAYAEQQDFANAIEWEQKAIELAGDNKSQQKFNSRLEMYKANLPYHRQSTPAPK